MHQSYRYAILYFSIFGFLLLLSGAVLFISKLGISYESISLFYLGSSEQFSQPKSTLGLLETALPHLGAMGLFIFVTGHFLLFSPKKEKVKAVVPAILMFVAALVDIGSGFLITQGITTFIWIKIIAFLTLQLTGIYLLFTIFSSSINGLKKYATK